MLTRAHDARVKCAVARGVVLHLHNPAAQQHWDVSLSKVMMCTVQGISTHTSKELGAPTGRVRAYRGC